MATVRHIHRLMRALKRPISWLCSKIPPIFALHGRPFGLPMFPSFPFDTVGAPLRTTSRLTPLNSMYIWKTEADIGQEIQNGNYFSLSAWPSSARRSRAACHQTSSAQAWARQAATAVIPDGNIATGAIVGAAGGALCDDVGICRR